MVSSSHPSRTAQIWTTLRSPLVETWEAARVVSGIGNLLFPPHPWDVVPRVGVSNIPI